MARRLPGTTVEEKLLLNHVNDGSCWRWTGAHNRKGYGQLHVGTQRKSVHRLAYELWVGPIEDGLEIDHTCAVRDCINPAHLEPVDHIENLQRATLRRTHCKSGHALTEENIKFTWAPNGRSARCRRCWNANQRRYRARKRSSREEKGASTTTGGENA